MGPVCESAAGTLSLRVLGRGTDAGERVLDSLTEPRIRDLASAFVAVSIHEGSPGPASVPGVRGTTLILGVAVGALPRRPDSPGGSEGLEVVLLSPTHARVPCPQMPAIAVLAAAAAAWCFFLQVDSRHLDALAGGAALNNANFLDNDQWLSTVSQYDRDKYWNRFRDVSTGATRPGSGK